MIKEIPIKDILIDPAMQHREVDDDVVRRYASLIKDGVKFPTVYVVTDGTNNYLWDGAHRIAAHLKLGKKYISANVENGSRRDAIYFSFSANKTNAFPRQPGTVKGIIETMLKDEEWAEIPQTGIADWVGCTQGFVSKIQAEFRNLSYSKEYDRTASTDQKQGLARAKTVKVKRGNSEYDMKTRGESEKKVLDSEGHDISGKHPDIVKFFERTNEYRGMIKQLNDMLRTVRKGIGTCVKCGGEVKLKDAKAGQPQKATCEVDGKECQGDLFYRYIKIENLTAEIGNVKRIFKHAMPYSVCGYCRADENNSECRACDGVGFVNEITWISTPKELK